MDTSKEYIEMSIEAIEIQQIKKNGSFDLGDFYFNQKWNKEYNIHIADLTEVDNPCNEFYRWLPRQDQLQELLLGEDGSYGNRADDMFMDFTDFYHNTRGTCEEFDTYMTYERYWLAFVMKIDFNKKWQSSSKEWINIK